MIFKRILIEIRNFFYPNICFSCGEIIEESDNLCENCKKELAYIKNEKRCLRCGLEKPDCDCRFHIYYFEGMAAVFFNKDSARNIVYRYKLNGKNFYADYIGEKMFECLNQSLSEISFDALVPVPTSAKSKRKKGCDHVLEFAKVISKKTNIPLRTDVIGVKRFDRPQHKNNIKKRFENASDKYFIKNKIDCENVLLVDDIKTTGATLNSCTRMLLFAGAKQVYCLTALATDNEIKK